MDPIAALLGLGIENPDQTQALADRLRGRQRAADFFSLSTVDPIARGAQAEQATILESAKTAGGLRKAMAERAAQDERARLQRENTTALQASRIGASDEQSRLQREQAAQLQAERLEAQRAAAEFAAQQKMDEKSTPAIDYNLPKTRAEREKFEKGDTDAAALRNLQQSWKEEYLPPPLTGLIGGGKIRNALANYMPILTDKNSEDAARWWKDYQRQAELVQRHEMFGSALTKSEQAAWEAANIDPSIADPETIKSALQKRANLAQKIAERQVFTALKNGYDPELIESNFGSTVDVQEMIDDGGKKYLERLRQRQEDDRKWQLNQTGQGQDSLPVTPTGDWTDEEEAEYQALMQKKGAS